MISLFSCKSTQYTTTPSLQTSEIKTVDTLKENGSADTNISLSYSLFSPLFTYNYEWISYRGKVKYNFNSTDGECNLFFVNKIDSIIYININLSGIEVVRLVLQPHEIIFVNKLNKTYYKGDYEFFQKTTGISINFYMLQSILNGKDFPNFNTDFNIIENDNQYILLHQNRSDDKDSFHFIQKIRLNQDYQMIQNLMTIKSLLKKIEINYSEIIPIENRSFFQVFQLGSSDFSFLINLKNIKFNTPGPTSIKIPESFKIIEFN